MKYKLIEFTMPFDGKDYKVSAMIDEVHIEEDGEEEDCIDAIVSVFCKAKDTKNEMLADSDFCCQLFANAEATYLLNQVQAPRCTLSEVM